jgi:hypothetical protein
MGHKMHKTFEVGMSVWLGVLAALVLGMLVPWPVVLKFVDSNDKLAAWVQALGAIAAIIAAFLVPLIAERRARAGARMGHLLTIATDVRITERQAGVYLRGKVRAPAYRVPLYGARAPLPALLADGSLDTAQATALVQFYVDATSFIYSLDLVQQLKNEKGLWLDEVRRTRLKAGHLVTGGKQSRFDQAIKALRKAGVPSASLQPIPVDITVDVELLEESD